jgi:hypothetical protein
VIEALFFFWLGGVTMLAATVVFGPRGTSERGREEPHPSQGDALSRPGLSRCDRTVPRRGYLRRR